MFDLLTMNLGLMADSSGAAVAMREYVAPTINTLAALASIACVFFIVNGGYLYMTSSGKPDALENAKRIMRNALLGLIIVLSAATITSILTSSYGRPASGAEASLPKLKAIPEQEASNGLVDVLIDAVTGLLNTVIQAVAVPFLAALEFFTESTPLMASNPSVFNLWLAVVGMTDVLFVIVLALIGFHVMSAASFGFDEVEFKHLLPRIGLVFLLLNTSIFAIDGIIELSNALITAINRVSGASTVWETLTQVVKTSGGQGIAALLMMLAFLIFSVFLLVYYVLRLVTLFIGAVVSPLVVLIWLIPGFRDFSETAIKTYITTIFVLFVHVIILLLSASLFAGMASVGPARVPDTLISMIIGLATILALLRTQGAMVQLSYVSMGSRNMRKLGGQFMNGVSYMSGKGALATRSTSQKIAGASTRLSHSKGGRTRIVTSSHMQPHMSRTNGGVKITKIPASKQAKNPVVHESPMATPRTKLPPIDNVPPIKKGKA